jgi:hypothetical protein
VTDQHKEGCTTKVVSHVEPHVLDVEFAIRVQVAEKSSTSIVKVGRITDIPFRSDVQSRHMLPCDWLVGYSAYYGFAFSEVQPSSEAYLHKELHAVFRTGSVLYGGYSAFRDQERC